MPLPGFGVFNSISNVEPMQMDVDPEEGIAEDQQIQHPEANFVVENPSLDLDLYASSYTGLMRLERLLFVATHAPSFRVDALRMALAYVKKTLNVSLYEEIHRKLVDAIRSSALQTDSMSGMANSVPSEDMQWVEQTRKHASNLLEKLDIDLKNYKSNSIKESIRRGFDDLGNHYLNMGDLNNALKCYSRARDYCTSAKHIITMCLNIIKVCVYLSNWSHVLTYVNKAETSGDFTDKEKDANNQTLLTKLKCAAGLAQLGMSKYKAAAKSFLQASVDHFDIPEYYNELLFDYAIVLQMLSPNNVAIYGSLCALATFTRHELQIHVITSSSFKLLLELEPNVREIVFAFYKSQYARCLTLLQESRENFLLDLYLSPHLDKLYNQIRCKALVQALLPQFAGNKWDDLKYFSPYKLADMRKMANAFNCTVNQLENELMPLILEGQIQARIDSQNKVLHAREIDHRSLTFAKTIQAGREFVYRTRSLILRNAIIKNNLTVQVPSSKDGEEISNFGNR